MTRILVLLFISFFGIGSCYAQEPKKQSTVSAQNDKSSHFAADTLPKSEQSPLDIANDRGIFILTKDHKMQLRILGSIRYNILYDFTNYPIKNTLNSYYVPVGDENINIPNFYSHLNQSRLGFEVTRKIDHQTMFVRLETDFAGPNGAFRIRHAYGKIGNFLLGQTWSLFSSVSCLPATVDINGPTGTVLIRTAQARFGGILKDKTKWNIAIEYSLPDLNSATLDTFGLSTVQLVPDLTARIQKQGTFGRLQLSGVLTTLSFLENNNNIKYSVGLGGSLSGSIDLANKHSVLYQFTYGKGISHFITTFSGTGMDATYNQSTGEIIPLFSFGGYLSYGFDLTKDISSTLSVGYADLGDRDDQELDAYRNSMSVLFDTFWTVIEGARVGVEYAYAQRWNVNGDTGHTSRISALVYYDF